MRLSKIRTETGWIVRLSKGVTITQGEGATLEAAMLQAFTLLELDN